MTQTRLLLAIKVSLSILLLWFLTHTAKLNFSLLPNMLHYPMLLGATILMYIITVSISTWRWQQLNRTQKINLSYKQTILPTYMGIAFNNLLPGGVGGDFFRFYFMSKKTQVTKSAVMLSVFLDRVTGLGGIFVAVGVIAIFKLKEYSQYQMTAYFANLCFGLCVIGFALYWLVSFTPKKLKLSNWINQHHADKKWGASLIALLMAIKAFRHAKTVILECLGASVMIQVLIALTCMLIAKMMHFPAISFADYMIAIAVTQIVNLIPIAPGGFGVGEMAFANILTLLNPGISATYATIFLAYRLLGMLVCLPGAFVFLFDKQLLQKQYVFANETTSS